MERPFPASASRLTSTNCLILLFTMTCLFTSSWDPPPRADVVTYHNDLARTGQNLEETILTTDNVNSSSFGKRFTMRVDGVIDAEPLYLSRLSLPGQGTHNVLYAVTENDTVYAFDADLGTKLWQVSLLRSGETPSGDFGCGQIGPQIGITSTPVIDRSSGPHGTIYVVAMSKTSSDYFQRIHALDVTTGREQFGGPVTVTATYPGRGDNSQNGSVLFDPKQYAERQGLLLLNHVVYTGWTSHCDFRPYTGWLIGYDERTLAQTSVLNLTPNGHEGSIWQSGAGMASDGTFIYFLDANGTFDTALDARDFPQNGDFGQAFLKVSTQNNHLAVADYFEMHNGPSESNEDEDFGSGGALLLPKMVDSSGTARYLAIGAGKDSNIYIVDRTNLGKFHPTANQIYQQIDGALDGGMWAMPAFFGNSVYFGPVGNNLLEFKLSQARLSTEPVSKSSTLFPYPGTIPSISADAGNNEIVWAIDHSDPNDVLHAYDGSNLQKELYNSAQAGIRDRFGQASHFGTPMIANGKVYVGTTTDVTVFGLLSK
jgi:outer membrane protein assembly factor BamB